VTLKVVDASDGTMLNANASVTDMQGNPVSGDGGFRMVFNGGGSGQPIQLSLSPGSYRVTVMAPGYARQTIVVSSPSTQTVALTPGGTLLIHASNATGLRGRLVDSNGLQYLPNPPNTGFTLLTGTTTLQNVAGGHYRLDVLDSADRVVKSIDVDVVDGATADYSV
jgi:hypothetical protein